MIGKTTIPTTLILTLTLMPILYSDSFAQVSDNELVKEYNEKFSNNTKDLTDELKAEMILSMRNASTHKLQEPVGQTELANKVIFLLQQIENTNDVEEKLELQIQLDALTEEMLKVGLVLSSKYNENPKFWDSELDRTSDSPARTGETKDDIIKKIKYENSSTSKLTYINHGDDWRDNIFHKFDVIMDFLSAHLQHILSLLTGIHR